MKKLILLLLFVVITTSAFCQETIWFETTQANIGVKEEYQTEYTWGPSTYPAIRIGIEKSRVVIYAEHLYIININGTYNENAKSTTFYGKDDEGIQCHVELGLNQQANRAYLMVMYSDLAFFYYIVSI
jgi:hypothetical protein